VIHGVLLGSKTADPLRTGEQAIINLEICRHGHTVRHTMCVSRLAPFLPTLPTCSAGRWRDGCVPVGRSLGGG
jgi:hypothetical protein